MLEEDPVMVGFIPVKIFSANCDWMFEFSQFIKQNCRNVYNTIKVQNGKVKRYLQALGENILVVKMYL